MGEAAGSTLAAVAARHSVADPLAFYSIAATVIPVFVFAGLYQANVEDLWAPAIRFVGIVLFMLTAVIGEAAALHVLATGHPTSSAKAAASISLEANGLLLLSAVVVGAFRKAVESIPRESLALRWLAKPIVFYLLGIMVIGLFVVAVLRATERI